MSHSRLFLISFVGLMFSFGQIAFPQEKEPPIAPAEKLADGWDAIDDRLIFLMVRLANTEASLEAVDNAIAKATGKKSVKTADAKRADLKNEEMDRRGGGPVRWSSFYGTTAEKFFYHPTDRNSTYHTDTLLVQKPPKDDNQVEPGVPSRQGLPVHQRPPQFDYIYRTNEKSKARAVSEVAEFKGKIESLLERRRRLEVEQAGLWCDVAFRAVGHYDLHKKPIYRFEPLLVKQDDPTSKQHAEIIKSAAVFMRMALSIIDAAEKDQSTTFSAIKVTVAQAREKLDDTLLRQSVDVTDKKIPEAKFAALAKRLEDVASNLSESYEVAAEGDKENDQQRKDTFRGLLQESLVSYAQIILALDEMSVIMKDDWKIKPDLDKPLAVVILARSPLFVQDAKLPSVTNSIGLELIEISAGKFLMGDENRAVNVTLTKPFLLGKYEVTQGQWKNVMSLEPWVGQKGVQIGDDNAASFVHWDGATEFCKRLTDIDHKNGNLPAGESYRLPTEAEWEYACRAGTKTAFSFGDDEKQFGEYAWFDGNAKNVGEKCAHKVGLKKPNPWGLHDMHGNVWEWCSDWNGEELSSGVDPAGPNRGSTRVLRGGSWWCIPGLCRSAFRNFLDPLNRNGGNLGFRVARSQSKATNGVGVTALPWDFSQVQMKGKWTQAGESILSPSRDSSWIEVPAAVGNDYTVLFTAVRVGEGSSLNVGLPLASGNHGMVVIGAGGAKGLLAIEMIDGKSCHNNETTRTGFVLQRDVPVKVAIRVSRNRISVSLDGHAVIDWGGDLRRLSLGEMWTVPKGVGLFLGSQTAIGFSDVVVRER